MFPMGTDSSNGHILFSKPLNFNQAQDIANNY